MADPQAAPQRAGLGYNYESVEIPQTLTFQANCATREVYKTVITTIYNTLRVRDWPDEVAGVPGNAGQYVASRYCNLPNADMRDRIRTCHASMADARNTPLWLYRLLKLIEHPPVLTRNQLAEVAAEFDTVKGSYAKTTSNFKFYL